MRVTLPPITRSSISGISKPRGFVGLGRGAEAGVGDGI